MYSQQLAECLAIKKMLSYYVDSLEREGIQDAVRQDMLGKAALLSADELSVLVMSQDCHMCDSRTTAYGRMLGTMAKNIEETKKQKMKAKGCIIFIHGLGSNHERTWKVLEQLVRSHYDLAPRWETKVYEFETKKVRPLTNWFFGPRYLSIPQLAKGLKTFIEIHCEEYESVVLIGHSMGGLVTAKFLTTEHPRMNADQIKGAMFFATPFEGSHLANIADAISFRHTQVRAMIKSSGETTEICEQFKETVESSNIPYRIIGGGQDRTVPPDRFAAIFGGENYMLLSSADHGTITFSGDHQGETFMIVEKFLKSLT